MNDSNPQFAPGNKPSHIAYHVREAGPDKAFWNRVGVAWAHADGQGFNLQLESVPLDGRLSLRVANDKPAATA